MLLWRLHYVYSNLQNIIRNRHAQISNKFRDFSLSKTQAVTLKHICQFISFVNILGTNNSVPNITKKVDKYWIPQTFLQLLEEADRLYNEESYLEVYEILNRIQHYQNVEIQWRICRSLFKMACDSELSAIIRENMIQEAYSLIMQTLVLDDNHPEVHKWTAIIMDAKTGLDGTASRVKSAPQIKYHMQKSLELNSEDPCMLYMLGNWCYEMTNLNWMQRCIAKYVFFNPPEASCEEAYQYFLRAEQLKPRFFAGNIYMLGKCCFDMGHYYRARYYLKIAAELPVNTDVERKYTKKAKLLAEKLKAYDINVYRNAT